MEFRGMSAVNLEYQRIHVGILDSKNCMYWAELFEGKWKDRGLRITVWRTNVEEFFRIHERNSTKIINPRQFFCK